ncbi:MAG TPA: HlyD family secretion protein [Aliidongia sp.]|nr:HlyD family secretion protein [Aliidongia sp.]
MTDVAPRIDTAQTKAAAALPVRHGGGRRLVRAALSVLSTLAAFAIAAYAGWLAWQVYMDTPWTRDGMVRAYVVTIAPEVAGRIVQLPVGDNQLVHKGDLLMVIDPINYKAAVAQAEANVTRTRATAQNATKEASRRQQLTDLAASTEEKERYSSSALAAQASYQHAQASLDLAQADLVRTRVVSPVDGYVTNLQVQLGDFANVGQKSISVVNTGSFWVDGYFEETSLRHIHEGDPATVHLMGHPELIQGHVESIARGITVTNAQADSAGLATVNPIFTWVRLAQRVPVRVHIDHVPDGVRLVVGLTATVQIDPAPAGDKK